MNVHITSPAAKYASNVILTIRRRKAAMPEEVKSPHLGFVPRSDSTADDGRCCGAEHELEHERRPVDHEMRTQRTSRERPATASTTPAGPL